MYDSLCKEFCSITLYTISSKLYSGSCYSWFILRIFIDVMSFPHFSVTVFFLLLWDGGCSERKKLNLLEIYCENPNNMVGFGYNLSSKRINKLVNTCMSLLLRNTFDVHVCCRCSCLLSMFTFAVDVHVCCRCSCLLSMLMIMFAVDVHVFCRCWCS